MSKSQLKSQSYGILATWVSPWLRSPLSGRSYFMRVNVSEPNMLSRGSWLHQKLNNSCDDCLEMKSPMGVYRTKSTQRSPHKVIDDPAVFHLHTLATHSVWLDAFTGLAKVLSCMLVCVFGIPFSPNRLPVGLESCNSVYVL